MDSSNKSSESSSFSNDLNLDNSLEEGRELMKMFINNKKSEVLNLLEEKAPHSMIHALGIGALRFFESILTLDKSNFDTTIKALKFSTDFADSNRRKSYKSYLFAPDYDNYTDQECHAELCYAKSLLPWGLITVLEDQSIYGFVNGALKIRASHQSYKECLNILKLKKNWSSSVAAMHFESGTRLGIGAFDLFISFFPNKMAKLLEFVGFGCDRTKALEELNLSLALYDGLLYDITSIILSAYYGFLEYFYGLGEGDVEYFNNSSKIWLVRTPDSAFVKLGLGIKEMICGRVEEAIDFLLESTRLATCWKQLSYACYWKIIWCNVMKCDWVQAANYARYLKDDCKWSPAMFTYLYAVFLFMIMEENNRPELKKEISESLILIPQLKRRLGGKRAFHEKLVIERSRKFHNKVDEMLLPPLTYDLSLSIKKMEEHNNVDKNNDKELIYIWNIFNMMAGKSELLQPFIERIEKKLLIHLKDKENNKPLDRFAYLTFMKGVCYRHLDRSREAIDCFDQILNIKKKIQEETHLLPQSAFEIGMVHRKSRNEVESKKYLKKARDDFSGYLTETMVHYRVQVALSNLKK